MASLASLVGRMYSGNHVYILMLCSWNLHAQKCDVELRFSEEVGTSLVLQLSELECGHTVVLQCSILAPSTGLVY